MKFIDDDTISIEWNVEDVFHSCENIKTKDQAREILNYVLKNHDANYGVSWDTLQMTADTLYPNEGK